MVESYLPINDDIENLTFVHFFLHKKSPENRGIGKT